MASSEDDEEEPIECIENPKIPRTQKQIEAFEKEQIKKESIIRRN